MHLYHATLRTYPPGEKVQAVERISFYPQALSALDKTQPAGAPSRSICVFATQNVEFSYLYALLQKWPMEEIKIYKVEMDSYREAPMAIVHALQRKIEKGQSIDTSTSEYWHPGQSWNFMEAFGPSMVILREVPAPSINEIMLRARYHNDADRASQL